MLCQEVLWKGVEGGLETEKKWVYAGFCMILYSKNIEKKKLLISYFMSTSSKTFQIYSSDIFQISSDIPGIFPIFVWNLGILRARRGPGGVSGHLVQQRRDGRGSQGLGGGAQGGTVRELGPELGLPWCATDREGNDMNIADNSGIRPRA